MEKIKWHSFIRTFGGSWRPWVARFFLTHVMNNPKFEIMSNGTLLEGEEVSINISLSQGFGWVERINYP